MAEDATEEPAEELQEIKRNFDSYVDRGVGSMGVGTKNVLYVYASIECHIVRTNKSAWPKKCASPKPVRHGNRSITWDLGWTNIVILVLD
jgi:hypothetical protein